MTKKKDEKLGVEAGPDELEPAKAFEEAAPQMTVPKEPPTNPDLKPITRALVRDLFAEWMAPIQRRLANHDFVLSEIHQMVVGVKMPDGTVKGGIGKAVHDVNNSAAILVQATQVIEDTLIEAPPSTPGVPHKSLPDRIAQATANRVIEIFQVQIRDIIARIEKLEADQHGGVNGAGPQEET